jgi:hypothetical protein
MPRSSFFAPTAVFVALIAAIAGLALWNGRRVPLPVIEFALPSESALQPYQTPRVPDRIVYPYSVVPGGIADPAAAAEAAIDPVVRQHYAGFELKRANMVDNPAPLFAHVSYRRGDRIFWTRNKVRIPRGERLLTDGAHLIRARCGNRIADLPRGDVEPVAEAVADRVLDDPILEQESAAEPIPPEALSIPFSLSLALDPPPVLHVDNWTSLAFQANVPPGLHWVPSILPAYGPVIGGVTIVPNEILPPGESRPQSERDPSTEVPEPATPLLIGSGLLAGFLLYRRRA